MYGRRIRMPRWQAIFGADYHFSGAQHAATPVPEMLDPLWQWVRSAIEPRVNGIVVNWYDVLLGHYIGKHRDSTKNMIGGAPIIMISFGQARTLRMRPWRRAGRSIDFAVSNGNIVVLPYDVNLAWTHEILPSVHLEGRRVSVTFRAFH